MADFYIPDYTRKPVVFVNNSKAHDLAIEFPGRIGILFGPSRMRPNRGLPYACDNDKFSVWSKGKDWDHDVFWKMLDKIEDYEQPPEWVVVPDEVGDAMRTFREWGYWAPLLRERGLKLALAVQDGMTPQAVRDTADPDVIFIGGSTDWKRSTVWNWCHEFPRVHVGRVNTEKWLWNAHKCGAESTDGTGWFRGNQKQYRDLIRYLKRSETHNSPVQLELEFARTFGGDVPDIPFTRKSLVEPKSGPLIQLKAKENTNG